MLMAVAGFEAEVFRAAPEPRRDLWVARRRDRGLGVASDARMAVRAQASYEPWWSRHRFTRQDVALNIRSRRTAGAVSVIARDRCRTAARSQ